MKRESERYMKRGSEIRQRTATRFKSIIYWFGGLEYLLSYQCPINHII